MFFGLLIFGYVFSVKIPEGSMETRFSKYAFINSELPRSSQVGYPDLPVYPVVLDVAGEGIVNVKPLSCDTIKLYSDIQPVLKPEILSNPNPKVYPEKDPTVYFSKKFYPETYFDYRVLRYNGFSRIEILLYPYRYNPEKRLLEVVREFEVHVDGVPLEKVSVSFPELYIVAPENLVMVLSNYIRERRLMGFDVKVETLERISSSFPGQDIQEKIRNYLKSIRRNGVKQYVILVGDEYLIPPRFLYAFNCRANHNPVENEIPSDLYYADLDGSFNADGDTLFGEVVDSVDLYPDLVIGRIPVANPEQLVNYLTKVRAYEDLADSLHDYILDYVFLAQILWINPYTDQGIHKNFIENKYLPEYIKVSKFYESTLTVGRDTVLNALSKGAYFVNHDGHGWYNGMWLSHDVVLRIQDTAAIRNAGKYSIFYSIGCWVGAFDFNSIAEAYVNSSRVAIAFIANSRYGWGAPGNPGFGYSDIFDNKFFEMLHKDSISLLGDIFWNHKAYFVPLARDSNVYRWIYYELNLLGDPTIYVWRKTPENFEVEIFAKHNEIYGYVTRESRPLKDVWITLSNGDSVFAKTFSSFDGGFSFEFTSFGYDSILLSFWKPGYRTVKKWIKLNPDFFVKWWFSDENGKDFVTAGESKYLKILFKNLSSVYLHDGFALTSPVFSFIPQNFTVSLNPGEDKVCSVLIRVPDSLKVNGVYYISLEGREHSYRIPVRISWPDLAFQSAVAESFGTWKFYFKNVSLMPLKVDFLGAIDPNDSRVYRSFNERFDVMPDSSFCVVLTQILPGARNLKFYFECEGEVFEKTVWVTTDSVIYSENFERGIWTWSGDTTYYVICSDSITGNRFLSYKVDLYPLVPDASIYSPKFVINGPAKINFRFWYLFPIYGTTGVKVSLEWLSGDNYLNTEPIALIAAGGALDSKNIYGSWQTYEYEVEPPEGANSARLVLQFRKNAGDTAFWGIDDIQVLSKSFMLKNESREELKKVSIVAFEKIGKGGTVKFLIFSANDTILPLEVFDAGGRLIEKYDICLKKGFNEVVTSIGRARSGLFFIKILGDIKKVVVLK